MTVHFIGAGPGAPDLITVRGLRLIERCPVCLYAGSLVPAEIVAAAPAGARVVDTAPMHLDEIIAEIEAAHAQGPGRRPRPFRRSLALRRHRRADAPARCARHRLRRDPRRARLRRRRGRLKTELTLPEIAQTVILTRTSMQASAMRRGESARRAGALARRRSPSTSRSAISAMSSGADPALRRRLPGGRRLSRHLAGREDHPRHAGHHREKVREEKITRTALILVGRVLDAQLPRLRPLRRCARARAAQPQDRAARSLASAGLDHQLDDLRRAVEPQRGRLLVPSPR